MSSAVLEIFMPDANLADRFCLRSKFDVRQLYSYKNWDEMKIASLKLAPQDLSEDQNFVTQSVADSAQADKQKEKGSDL